MNLTLSNPYLAPIALLGVMLVLMLASSWNDSATMDELAHIPAGYSYIFLRDYRLNPEHPPLIKDLAALPLVFYDARFPTDIPSWRDHVNGQWDQGRIFLYESGNDADKILRLMRLPMMILAVFLGWMLWLWTKRNFGDRTALLALFFYSLSPTLIAHSRLVTTDLAAALAFFIGIAAFLNFLYDPSAKNVFIAGLAFGLAQLLKFSLILLIPVYGLLLLAWVISQMRLNWRERARLLLQLSSKVMIIAIVGIILIWVVYVYHVWNYPPDRQYRDAELILNSFRFRSWITFDLWLIQNDFLRPLGQYLLGLFMVLQRTAGGNTQYFWGQVSATGSTLYFPVLYLLKETLTLHILSAIAVFFGLRRMLRAPQKSLGRLLEWIAGNFTVFASLIFIAIYWVSSLSSTLNIGVRHVLPTFPFVFVLVSREIVLWLRPWSGEQVENWRQWLTQIYRIYIAFLPRYLLVSLLVAWQIINVLAVFPYYISYYNGLGGGTDNGYKIGVDSNYDWGQDLKRLTDFVQENGIQKIALDYFGGGNPAYYLGEKFEPWWSNRGYPPGGGWFAISATFQMGAYGEPVKNFERKPEDSYQWLKPFRPVARAGKSIFIYKLPERRFVAP